MKCCWKNKTGKYILIWVIDWNWIRYHRYIWLKWMFNTIFRYQWI